MARKGTKHSDIEIKRSETAFEIVKETIAMGSPLHFHSYLEAELVVEGCAEQILNGKHYNVKRGSFYILRPMVDSHSVEINTIVVYKFYIKASELQQSLYDKLLLLDTSLYVEFSELETQKMIGIFDIMKEESQTQSAYYHEIIKNGLSSIIMYFLRKYGSSDEQLLRGKLLQFLLKDDRYLTDVALSQMAREFGYSNQHMSSLFSKTVGVSFTDQKILLRIQHATRLLLTTKYGIEEIAFMSGFSRYSLFSKAFKRQMGMSAREFRKRNSG